MHTKKKSMFILLPIVVLSFQYSPEASAQSVDQVQAKIEARNAQMQSKKSGFRADLTKIANKEQFSISKVPTAAASSEAAKPEITGLQAGNTTLTPAQVEMISQNNANGTYNVNGVWYKADSQAAAEAFVAQQAAQTAQQSPRDPTLASKPVKELTDVIIYSSNGDDVNQAKAILTTSYYEAGKAYWLANPGVSQQKVREYLGAVYLGEWRDSWSMATEAVIELAGGGLSGKSGIFATNK